MIDGSSDFPGAPAFRLRERELPDGTLRVQLIGELDVAVAAVLFECLAALIEERRVFSLDLSQLRFIDGAGLQVLRRAVFEGRSGGRRLVTVERTLSPQVERLIELTGVAQALWPEARQLP